MGVAINIVGQKFNRLLVLSDSGKRRSSIIWTCKCDCGNITDILGSSLKNGHTKSCGCFQKEKSSQTVALINKGKFGRLNHRWNPNLTDKERLYFRGYVEYKAWRQSVYVRDCFTCQNCLFDNSGNLIAHHLDSYADYPDKRLDIDNGITLCNICHDDFHKKYGKHHNTKEQFIEWRGNTIWQN